MVQLIEDDGLECYFLTKCQAIKYLDNNEFNNISQQVGPLKKW